MTVADVQRVVGATLPSIITVNWEPDGGKNQLDATVLNVLTRLSKDKAKSQGAQGTLNLRAVVKLKMASVAAAEKKEVEMSSTAAEEPPRRARKAIDRSAGRLVRPSEEDPRWTPGLGPSSRVQSAE